MPYNHTHEHKSHDHWPIWSSFLCEITIRLCPVCKKATTTPCDFRLEFGEQLKEVVLWCNSGSIGIFFFLSWNSNKVRGSMEFNLIMKWLLNKLSSSWHSLWSQGENSNAKLCCFCLKANVVVNLSVNLTSLASTTFPTFFPFRTQNMKKKINRKCANACITYISIILCRKWQYKKSYFIKME